MCITVFTHTRARAQTSIKQARDLSRCVLVVGDLRINMVGEPECKNTDFLREEEEK